MKKQKTTQRDVLLLLSGIGLIIASLSFLYPAQTQAGIVPPTQVQTRVGTGQVTTQNPNTKPFTTPDPNNPGQCIGGDHSCKPPCGISKSNTGSVKNCESKGAGCQTNGMPSCDQAEKDSKPPEMPKPPESPPSQPKPCSTTGSTGAASYSGAPTTENTATSSQPCPSTAPASNSSIGSFLSGAADFAQQTVSNVAQSAANVLGTIAGAPQTGDTVVSTTNTQSDTAHTGLQDSHTTLPAGTVVDTRATDANPLVQNGAAHTAATNSGTPTAQAGAKNSGEGSFSTTPGAASTFGATAQSNSGTDSGGFVSWASSVLGNLTTSLVGMLKGLSGSN